jgi:hypothetical protein
MGGGEASGAPATVSVHVVTDCQIRRLAIRCNGARLSVTLCGCSVLASAVEVAAVVRWAWEVPPDDVFPAIQAALR